jgi:glutamate formiminotransferase/formiminotetrahydrofolate cyclodeaminase
MPTPLVECVPNFSEGRDPAILDALRAAIVAVPGVRLLDVQADAAHHRSVFTFVAPPAAAGDAAFAAVALAAQRIDLNRHQGEHPRMGATDVVPFVPVRGVTMDDCVALARDLGARVGERLQIPVFLYARAATRPERERLPDVRKGQFEGLRDRIGTDPAADPDFGPQRIHPTAGCTAIGARPFLVAYNIYLDTADVQIAKDIAKLVRTSSGGLPAVQASGFDVGGRAQVSMNLLDIDVTPPAVAFARVEAEARARGVGVERSEVVGLIPERAIVGAAAGLLKLPDAADHLLEAKIREAEGPSLDGWLQDLASAQPVPGGGSASALAGALAAALVQMVCRLTIGKKAYAAVEPRAREILAEAGRLHGELRRLVDEDAAAYAAVSATYKLPKDDPDRARRIDAALLGAAQTPLDGAKRAIRVLFLAHELGKIGNKNTHSDATVALHCAHAAIYGMLENVDTNLASLSNRSLGARLDSEVKQLLEEIGTLAG